MKKVLLALLLAFGLSAMAQQNIQLRSADKAECVKSDMTSLKASFSFSTIEAQDYESERGTFSWLSLPNTVLGGDAGDPQIPVVNQLIAVPFGATPRIEITSYSTTDYRLADYNMHTLVPHQLPVRKSQDPDEVPFVMNEAAYQTSGLRTEPQATVSVDGIMRGVQLGTMTIEPVSYDPVSNTIRVFNDIEVTVSFDGADVQATEDMLLRTYSPAFDAVYAQLFNNRAITDVYDQHPDLYNTPVKMLVICYSGFQGNAALNSWLQWKLQKGYYVDIFYTNETGTSATNIKNFIKTKYNASVSAGNAYTYLIVIGDTDQVPQYMTKNIDTSIGNCASDLGYAAVNFTTSSTSNYFPDMYYSRISVENTTHLTNYMNKVLTYEKYEFTDGGSYLNNVILVGGWDSNWTSRVAKPTINYATNNYFNSNNTTYGGFENGTINATISTSSTQGWSGTNHGCYNGLNDGVCFLNYTAHGDKQEWYQPKISANQIETFTNTGKYFFGVGNCCLTGNFNLNDASYSSSYNPSSSIGATACFAETMIRVPNTGAIAYVGCSPYSYWYEDFYWAVGAHSYSAGNAPSVSSSSMGVYDVMFADQYWNSASALLYLGNLAVQQAVTNGNTNSSITDGNTNNSAHYYFQFYHTFGDGSIMPYITKPEQNTVSIPSTVVPGTSSITVNALAGSYVAVTDNSSVIYGVAEANASGVATVNFTQSIPGSGTLHVVVTRQQYQPWFGTIEIVGGTQYDITVNQPQHGTITAPSQAYANTTVTLTATPETTYCLSGWDVRDASNHSITVTNNQFTMPESNVTVTATFVQGLQVTLASVTNGSISADPLYALQGTTINLTATPAQGYEFESWLVYKTDDPNTTVTVTGDSFIMPNYDVTVSASFVLGPVELTVYDGTSTNQYIPMYGWYFDNYTKSEYIIPASQLTAMTGCTISAITFYPSSVATTNSTWANTSQTVFLKEVSSTTLGGSFSGTTGATVVKQALLDMPTAGAAYTITFDTPYTYNGGNLLIGVYNTSKGSYNKVEWFGTSNLTSGVSAYGNNSSSLNSVGYNAQSFLPKTTFTYMLSTTPYLSLTPNSVTMITGATETLTATYGNVSGTPGITYSSSNTDVATVSGSGTSAMVTAVAPGTATITASMTVDGTLYTATCAVAVEAPSYCTPNPTSVDGNGITSLTFGTGDYVVNNSNSSGLPSSVPYYGDYTSMVGGYEAGETATVTITYSTGSSTVYSYGTLIWVDWNKNYTFEDSEIVYTGTSAQGSGGTPQVLTATFTIPATQTADDYRMRIAGADSYFDSFIGGSTSANHDPCFTSTWAVCHDYTLRVISLSTNPVEITVSANPAEGGTVTGAGTYDPGTQCTLTATANEGYTFTNWTRNGEVMSTEATYSFTVSVAAEYVANFTLNSYTVIATAVPAEGGSVVVEHARNRDDLVYDFEDGWQGWTAIKGTTGTSPHNWMHNTEYTAYDSNGDLIVPVCHNSSSGMMLSESYISASTSGGNDAQAVTPDNYLVSPQIRLGGSITFYASSRMSNYPAEKFSVLVSESVNNSTSAFTHTELTVTLSDNNWHEYTVDLSAYSGMGYVAIRHYDCYDQHLLYIDDVTIVEGQDSSIVSNDFNHGETCVVTATPNADYYFVNWTENGTVVSTSSSYTFTVTSDRDLVANFSNEIATQTVALTEGWNWFSLSIDGDPALTLQMLEDALGSNAVQIKAREGQYVDYDEGNWFGNLTELTAENMYMIYVTTPCTITLQGQPTNPVNHEITINPGWNWIGFPCTEEMSVEEAFADFDVEEDDELKSRGLFTTFDGEEWFGGLTTLQPGQGYMYYSNSTESKTLVFPTSAK